MNIYQVTWYDREMACHKYAAVVANSEKQAWEILEQGERKEFVEAKFVGVERYELPSPKPYILAVDGAIFCNGGYRPIT